MRYIYSLFIVLIVSCAPKTPPPSSGENDMTVVRYLALGDSYTIGESVPKDERWPHQLADLLKKDGYTTEVTIIARTGWTTEWSACTASAVSPHSTVWPAYIT